MNTDAGLLVVILLIVIIVVSNGLMFLWVRSWTRDDPATRDFLNKTQSALKQPFQKEDKSLEELRNRVNDLKKRKTN